MANVLAGTKAGRVALVIRAVRESSEGELWELKPKSTCNLATVSSIIGRGEQIKIDETLKWLFGVQGIDKYPNFKSLSSHPGQTRGLQQLA